MALRSRAVATLGKTAAWIGLSLVAQTAAGQNANIASNTVTGQVTIRKLDGREARVNRANVVVFLESQTGTTQPSPTTFTISQKGGQFSPRVAVVTTGSTIRFPNDDSIFHNVFSLSKAKPFDLGVYAKGEVRSIQLSKSGLIKVYCNIHPDMVSYIIVLPTSLFALSDQEGRFKIEGVPDGTYSLRTWHEFGGETSSQLTLSNGTVRSIDIEIQEGARTLEHLNKFGQRYRGKYK